MDTARTQVTQYFRKRPTPRFFIDGQALIELSSCIASEHSVWKVRTLEQVCNDCERALPIYQTQGPPLRPGFSWGALPHGPGNDVLYAVRPQRFAFAPRMALAALYGAPTAGRLFEILSDWMEFAASGQHSLPYLSNLVVIQRFLALSWAWAFLAARPKDEIDSLKIEFTILKILHADAQFLVPRLGNSYPNNHLLADAFAGWYIGVLFPEWITAPNWRVKYEALWLRELSRQTLADGTGFEHSLHYHEFACEMAAAYILLSRRNGYDIPKWVFDRTERMLRFQTDIGGEEGIPLAIGDATEDPLFPLDVGEGWGTAAWREVYRSLYRPDLTPAAANSPEIERAFWLLGGNFAPLSNDRQIFEHSFQAYAEGGFFIFNQSAAHSRLIFRTGPVPERPLCAGHMHADLLSIYLILEATPVIVEAGTYSYRFSPLTKRWRTYFQGPRAHNGLAIGEEDPLGTVNNDFRAKYVSTRVETTYQLAHPVASWVEGKLVGDTVYTGYRRGVIHIRDEYWLVYDLLPLGIAFEQASFGFQFAPETQINIGPGILMHAETQGQNVWIAGSNGLSTPEVVYGCIDPPGGWVSRQYGELMPAPQVKFGVDGSSRMTAFLLQSGRQGDGPYHIETNAGAEGTLAVRIITEDVVDYLILRPESVKGMIGVWDILFDGTLLWLRISDTRPIALRWLEGRSVSSDRLGIDIRLPGVAKVIEVNSTLKGFEVNCCSEDFLSLKWPAKFADSK